MPAFRSAHIIPPLPPNGFFVPQIFLGFNMCVIYS